MNYLLDLRSMISPQANCLYCQDVIGSFKETIDRKRNWVLGRWVLGTLEKSNFRHWYFER